MVGTAEGIWVFVKMFLFIVRGLAIESVVEKSRMLAAMNEGYV